jgi:transposase InsO family protein
VSTYQHIAQRAGQVPARQLCQVLRVAPSAYYAWQRRQQVPATEPAWQVAVRDAFADHSQRYGTRRLRAEVQAQGHAVGRWRIRRVLKLHGLRAQPPRSFVPRTTDLDPAVRAAPNRLLSQPAPTAPNRVWVGDITYLPRQGGGWLYLAVWLDRCSRKIVGWDVRARHARRFGERSAAPGLGRAPAIGWTGRALQPGQLVHGNPLQGPTRQTWRAAQHEPAVQLLRQRPRRIILESL